MASPPVHISPTFARNVTSTFKDAGEQWLRSLPALLSQLAAQWSLTIGSPYDLSFNYVAPVSRAGGSLAVLKVSVPTEEFQYEMHALQQYGGDGCCRLLEVDVANCAILLERVEPGDTLVSLARTDDDAATRIAAQVMRTLWRPVEPQGLLPLASWFDDAFAKHRAYYGGPGPFPAAVLDRAERLARDLLAATRDPVLLHGDCHHYNILTSARAGWLAIDPKGVVGDRGFDVGQFFLNPDPGGHEVEPARVHRRLAIFAEELALPIDYLRD
jgi:streptomycin 6-kinase